MEKTSLYIIPTPIGNLDDITLRAIKTLKKVDIILAEDTRHTRILLNHLNIHKALQSYHIFNEKNITANILAKLKIGKKIALVSNAGTPLICDPGFLLVKSCIESNLIVECLPGPTAFVPALVQSGLPTSKFVFEGFLPHKRKRRKHIENLLNEKRTIILYESPHRLLKTLREMTEILGNERKSLICREISKKFEETIWGTLLELYNHFQQKKPKGEFVLLIEGKK